jgi:hypothetical protein
MLILGKPQSRRAYRPLAALPGQPGGRHEPDRLKPQITQDLESTLDTLFRSGLVQRQKFSFRSGAAESSERIA